MRNHNLKAGQDYVHIASFETQWPSLVHVAGGVYISSSGHRSSFSAAAAAIVRWRHADDRCYCHKRWACIRVGSSPSPTSAVAEVAWQGESRKLVLVLVSGGDYVKCGHNKNNSPCCTRTTAVDFEDHRRDSCDVRRSSVLGRSQSRMLAVFVSHLLVGAELTIEPNRTRKKEHVVCPGV